MDEHLLDKRWGFIRGWIWIYQIISDDSYEVWWEFIRWWMMLHKRLDENLSDEGWEFIRRRLRSHQNFGENFRWWMRTYSINDEVYETMGEIKWLNWDCLRHLIRLQCIWSHVFSSRPDLNMIRLLSLIHTIRFFFPFNPAQVEQKKSLGAATMLTMRC